MERNTMATTFTIAAFAALFALPPAAVAARPASNVPGAEAYQTMVSLIVDSGVNGVGGNSSDPVSAERRLVIEFVSVMILVLPGQRPQVSLVGQVNGGSVTYAVPLTLVGTTAGFDEYRATHQVRLYHDGNGSVGPGIQCGRVGSVSGPATCTAAISGYLIAK